MHLLEKTGKYVKVIDLGASGDPDDFIRKHGADAFRILLERSENNIEYRLLELVKAFDMKSNEGRLKYLAAATDLLADIKNDPEREIYGVKVAQAASVSTEAVKNEVSKKQRNNKRRIRSDEEKNVTRVRASVQPAGRELRYANEFSAVAEEGVIRLIINDPELMKTIKKHDFSNEEFTSPFLAKVYEILDRRISESRDVSEKLILSELESGEASQLTSIMQKPETIKHGERIISEYIEKIRAERLKTQTPDEELLLEIKRLKEKKI